MNWEFVRREWGAATFVLTVLVGMIIVPLALYFTNAGPAPLTIPVINTVTSARPATTVRPVSPTPTTSPSPSATPSK